MTRFILLSLFHFCICCSVVNGQSSLLSSIPDSLIEGTREIIHNENIEFEVHSPSTATYKYYLKATILSSESTLAHAVVPYDTYSKSKWMEGTIYDASGKVIRKIKNKDLNDIAARDGFSVFNDNRYYYVEMSNNRYPYTIEYAYEREYSSLMYYPDWHIQSYYQHVQNSSYSLILPTSLTFDSKALNIEVNENVRSDDKKTYYHWSVEDLPTILPEKMSGPSYDRLPKLLFAPHSIVGKNWSGTMQDWDSFGKFIYTLNEGRDKISPELESVIKKLVSGARDDREKIELIYGYLKENTRYVSVQIGIGGWQSFDADYVEQNKYGDCKALSNYMRAMLKSVDISSNLVIIANGSDLPVDVNFVDPSFNHMILHVPNQEMFLECTSHTYPTGYIGWSNANRDVLAITKEGGKIIQTPKFGAQENHRSRSDTLIWAEKGLIKLKGIITSHYQQHERIRHIAKNLSSVEQEKYFLEQFPLAVDAVHDLNFACESDEPKSTEYYHVSLSKIGSRSGDRIFLPAVPLESFTNPLDKLKKRSTKIKRDYTFSDQTEFIINLPKGYLVESIPKEIDIQEPVFGSYQIKFVTKDNCIIVQRKLIIEPIELEAAEYQTIYDWYQAIEKSDGQKIVLKKAKNRT